MDYWPTIERLARSRGAKEATIKKWRQRGVPWRWRAILTEAAGDENCVALPKEAFEAAANQASVA